MPDTLFSYIFLQVSACTTSITSLDPIMPDFVYLTFINMHPCGALAHLCELLPILFITLKKKQVSIPSCLNYQNHT
jgi:hypothetical protein